METKTTETTETIEKIKRIPKASVTVDGTVLLFTFGTGQTLAADAKSLTCELYDRAAVHGLEQKLRDSYAGAKTADEAYGLCNKVMDHLFAEQNPTWTAGREGGPSEDSIDLLARAIVNVAATRGQEKSFDAIRAKLAAADKATRAAYRAVEEIGLELVKLKAAKSTPKVSIADLDSL